ncbi:MAG: aminomethyl-transferring glycine dehydrogenase subunit GcvPA [Deltaproteobacteria bacterium]|jgi:glycine dehydrogenase subunit 1|nr:aminomethyl-transferring glycine dehydrogenase subunit GcvPA [Deltaproteobacteria bacterium]
MRYLPQSEFDIEKMLKEIGVDSIEELFASIPKEDKSTGVKLEKGRDELHLCRYFHSLATKNKVKDIILAGGGVYPHNFPAAAGSIVSRPEFATAYTPYQPEVSQGTLQAIFEFQTIVSELMQLEVANASMYDAGSALGEALLMAYRANREKRKKVLVSKAISPDYLQVVKTMLQSFGDIEIEYLPWDSKTGKTILPESLDKNVAAVALGYPNYFGVIEDITQMTALTSTKKALAITVSQDAAVLGMLEAPGNLGVDIAVAEGMSLAGTWGMGGPGVGLMATRKKYTKKMPGRIVGQTKDEEGNSGYVLTLATREQHIRREKATSNICTNQALVALAFTVHLSLLGSRGLTRINALMRNRALELYEELLAIKGVEPVFTGPFFSEFVLSFPGNTDELRKFMAAHGIVLGINLKKYSDVDSVFDNAIVLSTTELVETQDIEKTIKLIRQFYQD